MRLSVATKIFLCFAAALTAFGSVSITAIWNLHRLGTDLGVVSECYLPLTTAVAQIESFHKNKERDSDRILQEKDRATERVLMGYTRVFFPKMMRDRIQAARAVIKRSQKLARDSDLEFLGEMDRELAALYDRYGDYNDAAAALYDALSRDPSAMRPPRGGWEAPLLTFTPSGGAGPSSKARGRPEEADRAHGTAGGSGAADGSPDSIDRRAKALKQIEGLIGRDVQILATRLDARVAHRVSVVRGQELRAAWAIIGLTLGAILVGLLATGIAQRTLQPIRVLTEGVKDISRGDFARQVPSFSQDELGLLAQEFNSMAASLRERERELLGQRERLLRSERLAAIGRVSAQITHEIRNPLSSIGLNAELLQDALTEATFEAPSRRAEALALLDAMAREIDRLTEISEEYLSFVRPPRPGATRDAVDLGELAEDLLSFLSPELSAANVQVDLQLAPDLPRVVGDEGQLRQALRNLVRNAREAMAPRGGKLTVRARPAPDGRSVLLDVADQGPGVAPEALAHLFDPFFSTKAQGTGLGLALTQQIAADHGGSLSCQSPPGGGATFTMTLPAADEAAAAPPASASA